jgi:2-methylisocitrate lyase-like PEP mutase family enzyme
MTNEKAAQLRKLHHEDKPLILPNAWDAASAKVLAAAGFAAVATGSAAVAASLGYDDGETAPIDEMFAAARRITGSVDVPVTVDVEAGYGLPAAELAERLRDSGAAGCNIEDSLHPGPGLAGTDEQASRLAALRAADPDLVINARVDVFEHGDDIDDAVTRARAYLEAGADCVFPILLADEAMIATIVERVPGPVNILYRPDTPSITRLGELGVARVTFGPGLHRATLRLLTSLADKIRDGQDPY